MKQETTKKMPKWLLPVIIAAAVLVVAGILLAIFLPGLGQGNSGAVQSKLYWNVDRDANIEEESGMSIREKGADGLYTIRFAVDGEQVEYKTADKRLVNAIDMQDLMGLIFDADGLIADIVDPKVVATEVAKEFFVKEHKGNTLVVNSSQAMNGMPMQIQITENTGIYNVTDQAEVVGERTTTFQTMDKVTVYANEEGENTHIFIVHRYQEAGVYYRLERKYSADLASTTREPDANGVYTVGFAYEGEQVDIKFKDKALVDKIDAGSKITSPIMGLLFDEEGYAVQKIPVEEALRGKLLYSYWHVTDVQDTTVNVLARWSSLSTKGETGSFELPEDFDDIFLMETECGASHKGVRVDGLQKGDHVIVYTDFNNNPILIYVTNRETGYPLYYNVSRKYSSTTQETTRKPDENGYYVFEVAGEGKARTVKTKDKAIATLVDKQSRYMVGLKLEGDIILDACSPVCVTGRATAGTGRYVVELLGSIVRMASAADMTSGANYVINPECKIYDVSDCYGNNFGAETELRLGDRVQAARNPEGELVAIFVYSRYEEGSKLHFLPSRSYDSKKKVTTRVPDEEGYYVFEMASEGKWVKVKTKNKAMATYIDKQSSKFVALKVSNGIIKGAYNYLSCIKYGYATMKGVYYTGINAEGEFTYYTKSNGVRTDKTGDIKAENCVAYNVSTVYNKNRGEKTTLQRDDYIYAFGSREDFKITQVWVRDREVDGPLYWPVNPQFDDATGETARTPDAEGYYWIEVFADGKFLKLKTKDKALASRVDDYNYAFGLVLSGDEIRSVVGATKVKGIDGYAYRDTYVKAIEGNKVILWDNNPSSANYGKDLELVFTNKSKIYDLYRSSATYGQATELKVGDKIVSYQDENDKVVYCFIKSRGAVFGNCDACYLQALADGKTEAEAKAAAVKLWEVYDENTAADGLLGSSHNGKHYYLTKDQNVTSMRFMRVYGNVSVCVDLCGFNVTKAATKADGTETTKAELFGVDGKDGARLNILDSKGTSVITGRDNSSTTRGSAIRVNKGTCNVYGGTFRRTEDAKIQRLVTLAAGTTLNIYGGTFEGQLYSAADVTKPATEESTKLTVYAPKDSTLNIAGGTITGGVDVLEGATLTLAGAPNVSGLKLGKDVVANIDKLTANAKIALANTTEQVISKPSGNVANVVGCFQVAEGLEIGVTADKCLEIKVHSIPWTENAFTTDFDPVANQTVAYCEACYNQAIAAGMTETAAQKASMKRWVAYDGTNYEKDNHYYLTADYTIDAVETRFLPAVSGMTCLNLNGHSVTATGAADRALIYSYGSAIVNIMDAKGTAVLTGCGERYDGSGTVVELREGTPTINVYGGSLQSTVAKTAIGVHSTGTTPNVNIYGGTVAGINTRVGTNLTLAGAPQITDLKLAKGIVADLAALKPEASIELEPTEEGVFSEALDNAAAIKDCFTIEDGPWIEISEDNELVIVFPPMPEWTDFDTIFTTDFDPANNYRYAYCEACFKNSILAGKTYDEAVAASLQRWIAYDGTNFVKNQHYYLEADYTVDAADKRFISVISGTTCLNLNGHSVTATSNTDRSLFRVYEEKETSESVLNIMDAKGTGVLTGYTEQGEGRGSVIELRSNTPTINIYGGTLTSISAPSAIGVYSNTTPNVNLFGGIVNGINAKTGTNLKLIEAPQVTGLKLGEGVVADITELMPEAKIGVEGEAGKVISNVSANAATLKACFTAEPGMYVDVNNENQLVIVEAPKPAWSVDAFTTGFDPAANYGYGYCEACYKQAIAAGMAETEAQEASLKTWEAFDESTVENGLLSSAHAGKHYYLAEHKEIAGRFIRVYGGHTVCLNLNGKNITNIDPDSQVEMFATDSSDDAVLNIMDSDGTSVITAQGHKYGTRGSAIRLIKGTINVYGGDFRRTEKGAGWRLVTLADGTTLNVYGGIFEGQLYSVEDVTQPIATTPTRGTIYAPAGSILNVCGGTVNGVLEVFEGATLTLAGAPVIEDLKLETNAVANIDQLEATAQISVRGEADKVITIASNNAAAVKDCFTAAEGLTVEVNSENQLVIVAAAVTPDPTPDPEPEPDPTPDTPVFNAETAFTTDFDPAANAGYGYCEACYKQALAAGATAQEAQEASLKEWTVFTGGDAVNGKHYYLTQNFENYMGSSAGSRFFNSAGDTNCLNLNGKTVTMSTETTEALCRVTTGSLLNIMDAKGTGTLAGYEFGTAGTNSGTAVEVRDTGILNIYGGNFRRVDGSSANVAVGCHSDISGQINVYGGSIDGIYVRSGATVNLAGAPQITGLAMGSGVTVNIDDLLPAAQITVKGSAGKVFTVPSDNAAAVKRCFTAITEGMTVIVNASGALEIAEDTNAFNPATSFTTNFKPAENDGYAYCEACYKQALAAGATEQEAQEASLKIWEAYDVSLANDPTAGNIYSSQDGKHYYLTEAKTVTTTRFMSPYANLTLCFNLNGFNVTKDASATANNLFRVGDGATLNIMDAKGTSVITGRGTDGATRGSALRVVNGTCNIYGGTFRRTTEAASYRTVTVEADGTLNVYGGTIDGRLYDATDVTALAENQECKRSGMAVYLQSADAEAKAVFNLYNGTIYGGTLKSAATNNGAAAVQVGYSSNGYAVFNMAGGEIIGGVNEDNRAESVLSSGAVSIHANAEMAMTAGTISGGENAIAANLHAAGAVTLAGGTIDGGVLVVEGATLTLKDAPVITKPENGTGLTLAGAAVANIDELAATAQIAVEGEVDKIISNVSANAEAVKACFTVAEGLSVAVNAEGALAITEAVQEPQEPTWDPSVFTTGFDPANNEGYAYCEACYKQALAAGATEQEAQEASYKQWTAFTGGNAASNKHYYLTQSYENYSATARFMATDDDGTVCWNLNGHSVTMDTTSTEPLARALNTTLNIMDAKGTGVLTGYKVNSSAGKNGGSVVEAYKAGIVNVYGGTFLRSTAEGATGAVAIGSRSGSAVFSGSINIYGGTIDGVYMRVTTDTTTPNYLAGAPVITGLDMTDGTANINIDGLLPAAQITVKGSAGKVISAPSTNAAAVKNCFTAVTEGLTVAVNADGALEIVDAAAEEPNPAQFVLDWVGANSAAFRAEDKLTEGATVEAPCPFCSADANVTWTGIDGVDDNSLADGCHIYLIGDRIVNGQHNFLTGASTATSHCIYLNGFNVGNGENTSGTRIRARGGMNVIAYGSTLIRAAGSTATATYGTMMLQGGGAANFYGGTYINNDPDVGSGDTLQAVNLFDGSSSATTTFYDATLTSTVGTVIKSAGSLSLYNCTVNGVAGATAVDVTAGQLTIHNGTFTGSVVIADGATLVTTGTPVIPELVQNSTEAPEQGSVEPVQLEATVAAELVIPSVSEAVSEAEKCFTAGEGLEVAVDNGALVVVEAEAPTQPDAQLPETKEEI